MGKNYRIALVVSFLIAFAGSLFFASRPPFAFLLFGFFIVIVVAVGIGAAVRAHRRNRYLPLEFKVLTICFSILFAYVIAESIAHLFSDGYAYFVRPLTGVPLMVVLWLGEKHGFSFKRS